MATQNPSIKSAFENVAAGWVALAEQVERIDTEKSPVRDQENRLCPLTDIRGELFRSIFAPSPAAALGVPSENYIRT
jgi:hypothetical protein